MKKNFLIASHEVVLGYEEAQLGYTLTLSLDLELYSLATFVSTSGQHLDTALQQAPFPLTQSNPKGDDFRVRGDERIHAIRGFLTELEEYIYRGENPKIPDFVNEDQLPEEPF